MDVEAVKRSPSQEKYGRVQSAIRLLVLVVFLGWIFVWIVTPTNTYQQKWQPRLQAKTNSIFGAQGLFLIQLYMCKNQNSLHVYIPLVCIYLIFDI